MPAAQFLNTPGVLKALNQNWRISIAELRDHAAGRLVIMANNSTSLYLLRHIERYRQLYPERQGAGPAQFFQPHSK